MIHDYYALIRRNIILLLVLLSIHSATQAQFRIVADLKPGLSPPGERRFSMHASDGNRAFFVGNLHELWTSDGTTAGTKPLKRFFNIRELIVINGVAYFGAQTETHGYELWKSNGTAGGTVLVKDILPGTGSGNPWDLTNLNGILYFSVDGGWGATGRELWKSDGTSAGTVMVKDIIPGSGGSAPQYLTAVGNKVVFVAQSPGVGNELWISDGSAAGTVMVKDINPGANGSYPNQMEVVNGTVFFVAESPEGSGQLWKSNGTSAGTTVVKRIGTGAYPQISNLTDVNGTLFFQAYESSTGLELWRSDGTAGGTYLVNDFTPGTESSFDGYSRFINVDGKLFFSFSRHGTYNIGMSDGTAAGTKQVTFAPSDISVRIHLYASLYAMQNALYFVGIGPDYLAHLYRADVNGVVSKVEHAVSKSEWSAPEFVSIGNLHFFISNNSYWRSDGTSSGTWRLRFVAYPASSQPANLTDVGGTLYFRTQATKELWKTDGTAGTTQKFAAADTLYETAGSSNLFFASGEINSAGDNSLWRSDGTSSGTYKLRQFTYPATQLKIFNDRLYFKGTTEANGAELWVSDGTAAGTILLNDIYSGAGGSAPQDFTPLGEHVYFSAMTEGNGRELWRTNGQSAGTQLVKDIAPGAMSGDPRNLVSYKGKLYFIANDPASGWEVWQSGGTAASTIILKDVRTNDLSEDRIDVGKIVATKDWLYFSAINANNVYSLWRSNGTPAGTMQIAAFAPATEGIHMLTATETHAFFVRRYQAGEFELWSASASGNKKLRTFPGHVPPPSSEYFAIQNNVLYFTTTANWTGGSPRLLWRTDGTIEGTSRMDFVGEPKRLATSGPYVYLTGIAHTEGEELFIIEESISTMATAIGEPVEHNEVVLSYPNPFDHSMTLRVNGESNQKFGLRVVSSAGADVESRDLDCNIDHMVGSSWAPGLYIVQVRKGDRLVTSRVIKRGVVR